MINSANKIVGFLKSHIYAMEMIIFLKKKNKGPKISSKNLEFFRV